MRRAYWPRGVLVAYGKRFYVDEDYMDNDPDLPYVGRQ